MPNTPLKRRIQVKSLVLKIGLILVSLFLVLVALFWLALYIGYRQTDADYMATYEAALCPMRLIPIQGKIMTSSGVGIPEAEVKVYVKPSSGYYSANNCFYDMPILNTTMTTDAKGYFSDDVKQRSLFLPNELAFDVTATGCKLARFSWSAASDLDDSGFTFQLDCSP